MSKYEEAKKGTLTFRNLAQLILWKHELTGQLSDGHWENFEGPEKEDHDRFHRKRDRWGNPVDEENEYEAHWVVWCQAQVRVGEDVGRDFHAVYDRYVLNDGDLLEIVGQRMITNVRIGRVFGERSIDKLSHLFDIDGHWNGLPTHEGKHWDERRKEIVDMLTEQCLPVDDVKAIITQHSFGWPDLLRELGDMKDIIRTVKGHPQPLPEDEEDDDEE